MENKADVDGYYVTMGVGTAENMVDTRATGVPRNFTFSTTAGTDSIGDLGTAEIRSIHGRTLVWNQLVGADTTSVTLTDTHVFFTRISGAETRVVGDGSAVEVSAGDAVHDLTRMFGSGSEPATAADFKAIFPRTDYAFDAGRLLNFCGTGVRSVGFNLLDTATGKARIPAGDAQITGTFTALTAPDGTEVTPDGDGYFVSVGGEYAVTGADGTTCIHLVWSGYRDGDTEDYWTRTLDIPVGTYFPDGMNGSGAVYDEITADKAVKRYGKIDLGTLTWVKGSDGIKTTFRADRFVGKYQGYVITEKYPLDRTASTSTLKNGYISAMNSATNVILRIRDDSLGDVTEAEFKAMMSGVYAIYELVDPVETAITTPLNLTYPVDDFGTEELLPANDDEPETAPFSGVVAYSTDFPRQINGLPKNYTSQATLDDLLTALCTALSLTYTKTWDASAGKWTFTFLQEVSE